MIGKIVAYKCIIMHSILMQYDEATGMNFPKSKSKIHSCCLFVLHKNRLCCRHYLARPYYFDRTIDSQNLNKTYTCMYIHIIYAKVGFQDPWPEI